MGKIILPFWKNSAQYADRLRIVTGTVEDLQINKIGLVFRRFLCDTLFVATIARLTITREESHETEIRKEAAKHFNHAADSPGGNDVHEYGCTCGYCL